MCGRFWWRWAGAASGPLAGRGSATRRPFATGRRPPGRTLKKSPKRAAHHRFPRRERTEPAATPLPHLVAAGPHAGAAVSLQLEDAFGHRGHYAVELLLPVVSRSDPRSAGGDLSQTPAAAHSREAAAGVGPATGASQPGGAGIRGRAERPHPHRVPAGVRSRVESHGIHLGPLQAPQTPQRLPQGLRRTEARRPACTPQHAPPPYPDYSLLEAGFFMARMTLYYAGLSKPLLSGAGFAWFSIDYRLAPKDRYPA